jgi:putative transposase
MCDATGLSQRCACRLIGLSLSTCSYDAQRPATDAHLSGRITELALERRLIQPGKPTLNGFIESFNGRFRDECLNEHWSRDVSHARKAICEWRKDYNECRPHSTLNYQTPSEFTAGWRKSNSESEGSDITN